MITLCMIADPYDIQNRFKIPNPRTELSQGTILNSNLGLIFKIQMPILFAYLF